MWYLWLIFAGVFFIVEIFTTGFLIFWLGFAALLTMIVSIFTSNLVVQSIVFLLSSIIFLLSSKYFFKKIMKFDINGDKDPFSIIEKNGLVTEEINNIQNTGLVKIGGEIWSALSADNTAISKGSTVIVTKIEGVKAIVKIAD